MDNRDVVQRADPGGRPAARLASLSSRYENRLPRVPKVGSVTLTADEY